LARSITFEHSLRDASGTNVDTLQKEFTTSVSVKGTPIWSTHIFHARSLRFFMYLITISIRLLLSQRWSWTVKIC